MACRSALSATAAHAPCSTRTCRSPRAGRPCGRLLQMHHHRPKPKGPPIGGQAVNRAVVRLGEERTGRPREDRLDQFGGWGGSRMEPAYSIPADRLRGSTLVRTVAARTVGAGCVGLMLVQCF